MADYSKNEQETSASRRTAQESGQHEQEAESLNPQQTRYSPSILGTQAISGRGNGPVRAAAMLAAQRSVGNRSVQRMVQVAPFLPSTQQREDNAIARRIASSSGTGAKLEEGARDKLEEGLDADLSNVRVHTGGEADELARSVGATAFTTGQDIFFREGAYDPHSFEGLRLLAHETTHTLQQSAGPVDGTPAAGGVSVSDPSDKFEQAAERTADKVVSGTGASAKSEQKADLAASSAAPAAGVSSPQTTSVQRGSVLSSAGSMQGGLGGVEEMLSPSQWGGPGSMFGKMFGTAPISQWGGPGSIMGDLLGTPSVGQVASGISGAVGGIEGQLGGMLGGAGIGQPFMPGFGDMGSFGTPGGAGGGLLSGLMGGGGVPGGAGGGLMGDLGVPGGAGGGLMGDLTGGGGGFDNLTGGFDPPVLNSSGGNDWEDDSSF